MSAKTRKKKLTPPAQEKAPKSVVILGVIIILLVIGWIFGGVPYTLKYIECGGAPATVPLGIADANRRPELPGEEGYGPGVFKKYMCTKDTYLKSELTP